MWRVVSAGRRLLPPLCAAAGGACRPEPPSRLAGAPRGGCAAVRGAGGGGAGALGAETAAEQRQAAGRAQRRVTWPGGRAAGVNQRVLSVVGLLTSRLVFRSGSLVVVKLNRGVLGRLAAGEGARVSSRPSPGQALPC